ncbi:MAG: hypothetical protein QOJ11_2093 [Frankiales bacterium]|jgi:hypothetical protein|nr:hypothetical protein [Frankiales bacterium]
MTRWARLSGWRQDPADRLRQEAFLADIARQWHPTSAQERREAVRARLVHLYSRVFDGPPSLAPAAAAGVLAALGTALLPAAAVPSNPEYTLGPPAWAYLLITLGLIGLSLETARSPRRIRPVRYTLVVALPLGLGAGCVALMLHVATAADQALRIGLPALGLGVVVVAAAAAARRFTAQRIAMRITAIGCALTALGQLDWAWVYAGSGYLLLAVACACSAGGALLSGLGFGRAQLGPPQPPVPTGA